MEGSPLLSLMQGSLPVPLSTPFTADSHSQSFRASLPAVPIQTQQRWQEIEIAASRGTGFSFSAEILSVPVIALGLHFLLVSLSLVHSWVGRVYCPLFRTPHTAPFLHSKLAVSESLHSCCYLSAMFSWKIFLSFTLASVCLSYLFYLLISFVCGSRE